MFTFALLALSLGLTPGAHAEGMDQDYSVDLEMFRPNPDFYGYFHTQSAATLGHLQLGGGFWAHYSNDPLVLVFNGERIPPRGEAGGSDSGDGVIDHRLVSDVQLGLGLSRYFSFTLDAPLVLFQDGYQLTTVDNPNTNPRKLTATGMGDLRLQPKFVVLDRDFLPIGLSIAAPATAPTGRGGSFLGEENWTVQPTLMMEFSDGSIHSRDYVVRMALNAGYFVRKTARLRDLTLANEFVYGAALALHPAEPIEIVADFHGMMSTLDPSEQAAEILGGTKFLFGRYIALNLGGGAGLLGGLGAPDYRVFLGFSVAPSFDPNARDTDKDGIVNAMDRCKRTPEDLDGFQDEDGCPELDNDADLIEDIRDQCPNEAEDRDGFQDSDGCPDPDNDKDGILDSADRCPDEPETVNGHLDEDGCPDDKPIDDTDGDGYRDNVDRCPYDPEDFDGFEDEDGCPDLDNDSDGILDVVDRCPREREVFNGFEDEDGCPDEARVVVTAAAIEIHDRIYFDFNKATIQERSHSLCDEIASVVLAHPELTRIRVEGHTDSKGNDAYNLKLSQARAESVVAWLVSKGVERARLDPVGFGEIRPVDSNDTEDGRANNRRVEFIIVSREASKP
jgi:outer membrane protein OmpA-like peptidoglycan-associated protein